MSLVFHYYGHSGYLVWGSCICVRDKLSIMFHLDSHWALAWVWAGLPQWTALTDASKVTCLSGRHGESILCGSWHIWLWRGDCHTFCFSDQTCLWLWACPALITRFEESGKESESSFYCKNKEREGDKETPEAAALIRNPTSPPAASCPHTDRDGRFAQRCGQALWPQESHFPPPPSSLASLLCVESV